MKACGCKTPRATDKKVTLSEHDTQRSTFNKPEEKNKIKPVWVEQTENIYSVWSSGQTRRAGLHNERRRGKY